MQECSDEELLATLRATEDQNQKADVLNQLFGRYHSRVATWCFRFCGNRDLAADLAQDVVLKAYRNLGQFRGSSRFSTWLYTITRNHCVNEMKSRFTKPEHGAETLDLEVEDSEARTVLSELEKQESVSLMKTLMNDNLDPLEKQVLVMHFAEEIPLDSLTRLLGLTNASGAKAYIVSAKRKMSTAVRLWKSRQAGRS
jgi:RNA polymerase sigma-70 factor (ECF subfamily)